MLSLILRIYMFKMPEKKKILKFKRTEIVLLVRKYTLECNCEERVNYRNNVSVYGFLSI